MKSENSSKKNILVYNMNWLGDILFSFPSLEAIKKTFPNAHLACIVPKGHDDLLENQSGVDEVIAISDKGLWGKLNTTFHLRKKTWDMGFLFHRSTSRARILKFSKVKERIGYSTKNREKLLTSSYPEPSKSTHKMDYIRELL